MRRGALAWAGPEDVGGVEPPAKDLPRPQGAHQGVSGHRARRRRRYVAPWPRGGRSRWLLRARGRGEAAKVARGAMEGMGGGETKSV